MADREHVEQNAGEYLIVLNQREIYVDITHGYYALSCFADEILDQCVEKDVAFLVVGDPFG